MKSFCTNLSSYRRQHDSSVKIKLPALLLKVNAIE